MSEVVHFNGRNHSILKTYGLYSLEKHLSNGYEALQEWTPQTERESLGIMQKNNELVWKSD